MSGFNGKVAVITGGGSGIGKSTARLFAAEGARVVVVGRSQSALDASVAEIGRQAIGIACDVSDIAQQKRLADDIRSQFGAVDIYVANAGVIDIKPTAEVTPEDYDRQFSINTRGTFFGVQTMLPVLRDGASIIVTGSMAATKVLDNHAVYAGTKAASAAFVRNWALELKSRRIRANMVSPGPSDTAVLTKLGISDAERPGFLKMMSELNPAGRLGDPEEIARAIVFLASEGASFINGVNLNVDGGMSLV